MRHTNLVLTLDQQIVEEDNSDSDSIDDEINDDIYIGRLTPIMEQILIEKALYAQELDQADTLNYLLDVMRRLPKETFQAISDDSLEKRVRKLMTLKLVSGMLLDLSPVEIKRFDEAVAGMCI